MLEGPIRSGKVLVIVQCVSEVSIGGMRNVAELYSIAGHKVTVQ